MSMPTFLANKLVSRRAAVLASARRRKPVFGVLAAELAVLGFFMLLTAAFIGLRTWLVLG